MASRRKPERIKVTIFKTSSEIHRTVALKISSLIETRLAMGENVVLGLPTGSTPIGIYRELIKMHKEEGLDFSNVITFNLDEYYGVSPDQMQSYHRFMYENFFNHVNIKRQNIHILPGNIPLDHVEEVCEKYESDIRKAGGLDLTILGIGRDGHIAFNEPGSDFRSVTRMVILDETTRKDASSDFYGESSVPFEALTMGIQTILNSKELILCATSETKAEIIRMAVEGKQSEEVPATALQTHSNCTIFLNIAAAGRLTRLETPWEMRSVVWDEDLARKAIAHICKKSEKSIFELDVRDFDSFHLRELVHHYKGVDRLCRTVFDDFMGRVHRLEMLPKKSRILIFSPHPDDDVICMGGTMRKLLHNENEITVAYMVNGSVSVFDLNVRRHLRYIMMSAEQIGITGEKLEEVKKNTEALMKDLDSKKPAEPDPLSIQRFKANIRCTEALAAIEMLGLPASTARFLDLPFYQTGQVEKKPYTDEDVAIVKKCILDINPEHIYIAGDLTDPHGTHRMCYYAIRDALGQIESHPTLWLYRGAWQEWDVCDVDAFVPLSRRNMKMKIDAIFRHESQKDRAMFPGVDMREFWMRARDRNSQTADILWKMGFPKYFAVEAFRIVKSM
eukprot:TRINITY_DN2985_c0_g1_i1.p1 TRINITY_DN2985_c0_g1~~TRINITY_DN2985_c0_g1_i1.p1  ORF type:complete len:619 (-),score=172.73 TRINITY_DN2985_c0_g1_i1:259-2115(-)